MSSVTLPAPVRLHGRTLTASRLLYGLLLLLSISAFAFSLYVIFLIGTAPCDSIYHAEWTGCGEWFGAIDDLRLSAAAFQGYFLLWRIVAALPYAILSLLLVKRRGQELRILLLAGWLLVLGAAGTWFNPLWQWAGGWFQDHSSFPFLEIPTQLLTYLLFSGAVLFAFLFPDGRFVPRWTRGLAVLVLLLLVGFAFFPGTGLSFNNWPPYVSIPLTLFLLAAVITAIVIRYQRVATAAQRQQIKWVAAGFLLMVLNFLVDYAVWVLYPALTDDFLIATGRQSVRWELFQDTIWYASQIVFAICIALALLRHRSQETAPVAASTTDSAAPG